MTKMRFCLKTLQFTHSKFCWQVSFLSCSWFHVAVLNYPCIWGSVLPANAKSDAFKWLLLVYQTLYTVVEVGSQFTVGKDTYVKTLHLNLPIFLRDIIQMIYTCKGQQLFSCDFPSPWLMYISESTLNFEKIPLDLYQLCIHFSPIPFF